VHLGITLDNDQLGAQIFNTFITIFYMFWAISCSSSGVQIVLIQHLVSSLSVSDRPVHRCIMLSTVWYLTSPKSDPCSILLDIWQSKGGGHEEYP
jgi:hypothetical protein